MAECSISDLVQKLDLNQKGDAILEKNPSKTRNNSSNEEDQTPINAINELPVASFQSFMEEVNFCDSLITLPQGTKMLNTELLFVQKGIEKPIGITMLINGNVVVADRGKNVVQVHNPDSGKVIQTLQPGKEFKMPSDMTTLPDGRLVIRDNNGLQLFDEDGNYLQTITPRGVFGKCFGVASDMLGNILTINTNPRGNPNCITKEGETDILRINFEEDVILEKIELVDIIDDAKLSKCRFLQCDGRKVYVVDLGLNQIYVLTLGKQLVRKFGKLGRNLGEFRDPAGIAVDSFGNMIIADAGNNRLQVFDRKRNVQGIVKLITPIQRPSGIYLDSENKSLYILNLRGNSLVKVKLLF